MSIADSLRKAVLAIVGPRLDYSAMYPARVVSQAPNGTLQVQADDARIAGRGLGSLRIRYGIPGATATVKTGGRCLVGFDAQDPRRPYVSLWEQGAAASNLKLAADIVQAGGGDDFVALAAKVLSELENIAATFNGHLHVAAGSLTTTPVTGPLPGTPAVITASAVPSTNLKAD